MKMKLNGMNRVAAMVLALLLMLPTAVPALAEAEEFSAIVTSESMTVYSDAGLTLRAGTLDENTVVRILAYSGKAARISWSGQTGYALVTDMKAIDDVGIKAVTSEITEIYQSPSTDSNTTRVAAGAHLYVLAVKEDWAEVERDGMIGFIKVDKLVKVNDNWESTASEATPVTEADLDRTDVQMTIKIFDAQATDAVDVYDGPSTTSAKLGTLKAGQVVKVGAYTSDGWAYIQLDGNFGYCKYDALTPVSDEAEDIVVLTAANATDSTDTAAALQGTVTSKTLDVYKTASTSSKKLGTLKQGQVVNVVTWKNTWAYIELNGRYGYCNSRYLNLIDADDSVPTPTPTPVATVKSGRVSVSTLPVYKLASTKSKKLGTLKKNQLVNVVRWNSKWAYIELNGRYGYCAVKALKQAGTAPVATPTPAAEKPVPATVTVSKLPVYQTRKTDSKVLGTMKKGQTLNLVQSDGSWAYVELNGRYGYCAAVGIVRNDQMVAPSPTPTIAPAATPSLENAAKGTVIVARLAVYGTASTSGAKLGTLTQGKVVNVIKWNDEWAYIELEGHYGFCPVKGLSRADTAPTVKPTSEPSLVNAIKASVIAESTNVYQMAGTESPVLGAIYKGQVVNVLSLSGEWAYIERSGHYGFCKSSALEKLEEDDNGGKPYGFVEGGFTATVVYPGAYAYESPLTSAQSVNLALGETVNVYAYNSEWACIVKNSTRAFVPIKHLSRTVYSTVNGSGDGLMTLLKALVSYGYYDGVPSTSYNSAVPDAIKRFQAACGLEETGVADETVQRILYSGYAPTSSILASSMGNGDSGENVNRLQMRLYALGYLSKTTSVDGSYGDTTASAITLFQNASGLSATGKADVSTLKALYSPSAAAKPSSVKAADVVSATVVSPSGTVKLSSTYVTTMPAALKSTTSSYSSSMSSSQKLEHVIYNAQLQLGKPYVYGATGTRSFDCSGLTLYSFKKIGITLKRSAYSQGYNSEYDKISSVSSLKRGDLVFFNTISDSDLCDHVGIYLGGGCFIHASSGGHKVVVSNITSGYYNRVFSWGRRILK